MNSVRLRRMRSDYDRMCKLFTGTSRIRLVKVLGDPPEKYQIEFLVKSLQRQAATGRTRYHHNFQAEITLTGAYPRLPPQCRMLTPVFHPNIAPHAICIGDHWAAGESLADLVVRIAEMLAYQSYNVKSPLDGEAARWVAQNQASLPLDRFDFRALLSIGEAVGRDADGSLRAGSQCANCGARVEELGETQLGVCASEHVTCQVCAMACPRCAKSLCLACSLERCGVCGEEICFDCIVSCHACGERRCRSHTEQHRCSAAEEPAVLAPEPGPPPARPLAQPVAVAPPAGPGGAPPVLACANCGKLHAVEPLRKCTSGHLTCADCFFACPRCKRARCLACAVETCGHCGQEVCERCMRECPVCRARACSQHEHRCPGPTS